MPTEIFTPTADQRCPLCKQDNSCAVAKGEDAANCWCMKVKIKAEARSRANTMSNGQHCICPRCGAAN